MIKSFAHKGLQQFHQTGSTAGINAQHSGKLRLILGLLEEAERIKDLGQNPALRLHMLKGDRQEVWSMRVSGAWRVTFYFEDGDAHLVGYENYH